MANKRGDINIQIKCSEPGPPAAGYAALARLIVRYHYKTKEANEGGIQNEKRAGNQ
ncbi:MAG: hypothetical protein AB9883_07940 [Acidaminococcaceae bacterium]